MRNFFSILFSLCFFIVNSQTLKFIDNASFPVENVSIDIIDTNLKSTFTSNYLGEIFLDKSPELSETEWQIIRDNVRKNLAHDPIAVDELCRWCHVSANNMQSILFDLELSGYLQRRSGDRVL